MQQKNFKPSSRQKKNFENFKLFKTKYKMRRRASTPVCTRKIGFGDVRDCYQYATKCILVPKQDEKIIKFK